MCVTHKSDKTIALLAHIVAQFVEKQQVCSFLDHPVGLLLYSLSSPVFVRRRKCYPHVFICLVIIAHAALDVILFML